MQYRTTLGSLSRYDFGSRDLRYISIKKPELPANKQEKDKELPTYGILQLEIRPGRRKSTNEKKFNEKNAKRTLPFRKSRATKKKEKYKR
jgi:hypothetical protein